MLDSSQLFTTTPQIINNRKIFASPANAVRRRLQTTLTNVQNLKLESTLHSSVHGHAGCVNCLEWSESGKLLASGSDDHKVIIWQPFSRESTTKPLHVIETGHRGNIFSVKFIPKSCDTLVATCACDHQVRISHSFSNQSSLNCSNCHQDRVKRLAVHQKQPNLLWSAGEDGYIMQYDIREQHLCNSVNNINQPKNLLLDLKQTSHIRPISKCLALNPLKDEVLAIGSNDAFIRLFDRRYINKSSVSESCISYYSPGHMNAYSINNKSNNNYNIKVSCGTTNLSFNPNISGELLANIHAEQIYLFNTNEPCELSYKSFELSIKPLIYDMPIKNEVHLNEPRKNKTSTSYSRWKSLRRLDKRCELPDKYTEFYNKSIKKCLSGETLSKNDMDMIDSLLESKELFNCSELYYLRATALNRRGWLGDHYQAIKDSCCALALKPLDLCPLTSLAHSLNCFGDKQAVKEIGSIMGLIEKDMPIVNDECNPMKVGWNSPELGRNSNWSLNLDASGEEIVEYEPNHFLDNVDLTQTNRSFNVDLILNGTINNDLDPFLSCKEMSKYSSNAFDYNKRYCGHCNMNTDIKEASFFGSNGDYIVAGSDDGAFYIWDKKTTNIIKAVGGDQQVLNCVQPHPEICMLATSGIEPTVKLWSPSGKINYDVKCLEQRCNQNQHFVSNDPLEAMIMMLYSGHRY